MMSRSNLDWLAFSHILRSEGLAMPLTEHRFHVTRRWRFDYAWPEHRIALEVEGGVWVGGRHTSGAGFVKDMEKYNEAACLGWRIIRCQPRELCSTKTVDTIKRAMQCQ
jgi:very-short-patch-repair endonuclease